MWIGQQRSNGEMPAWSFAVKQLGDLQPLKDVLTKAIIETKTRALASSVKVEDSNDNDWLKAAVIAEDDELNSSQISFGLEEESNSSAIAPEDVDMYDDNEFTELEQLEMSEA